MAKQKKQEGGVLVQKIDIRQVIRSTQDIESWRAAIRSAESTLNPTRKLLYDLYSDILLDGTLTATIWKRVNAVLNSPLVFLDKTGNEVEAISNIIDTEEFETILTEILNARLWGYTLLELDFRPEIIVPYLIDRRHVKPELGLVVRNPSDISGERYGEPPYDRFVLTSGTAKDLGLLMKVAQYVIYKRGNFGDWAQFAEIFGMPFRKGTYDGFDEKARQGLVRAMEESGAASYAIIPEGSDIEFITNNSTGDGELYDKLRKACNEEIAVTILGNTLTTTQGDKGARSLGEVHQDVEKEIHLGDKRFVRRILNNRLLPLMELHGYPVTGGSFSFPEVEKVDKGKKIDIDLRIAQRQPVDDDYFYEEYGIPRPANYDQLKEEQRLDREMIREMKANPGDKKGAENLLNRLKRFFGEAPAI